MGKKKNDYSYYFLLLLRLYSYSYGYSNIASVMLRLQLLYTPLIIIQCIDNIWMMRINEANIKKFAKKKKSNKKTMEN